MKFQLLQLVIWPKSQQFAPNIMPFKLGMVNVITGASRTGKSAIIPIIDYCLASSDCFIPIDIIRDHASWYGIVFQTEFEQILIARKAPEGKKVSNEYFLDRGKLVSIPPMVEKANENTVGIKHILNTISSVPYLSLDGSETGNEHYQARLGFRDIMALVFQNQDIVANQNILFYKTHAHEHRERLRNWFPFILGAENVEVLIARQRLQIVEKRLDQLLKEHSKVKSVTGSWLASLVGHLNIAQEYGILERNISDDMEADELLFLAKQALNNVQEYTKTNLENIELANEEISALESEEELLSLQISAAKKRLNDVVGLRSGLVDYGTSQTIRADRLHISQWLESISDEPSVCPVCGNSEHPRAKIELSKVITAFKKHEYESRKVAEVPTSFAREEQRIKSELQNLLDKKDQYQKRFDLLMARDEMAQQEFQRKKSMFMFLGHLQASIETFERLIDGGDLQDEISKLQSEYDDLIKLVDRDAIKRRVDRATSIICQGMVNHLNNLDVEDKYRRLAPKFSTTDLNISVLGDEGDWHYLAEVGSASNWVSFHIALMCSLQEYFLDLDSSVVPSFVIFDQPSQVYFPKVKKSDENASDDPQYENEDVDAVRSIFETLAKSVLTNGGEWQCIVLDHADSSIYGDIEGIYEVAEWRSGKKLIPEEWYT